jgi:hypothetical protein
MANFILYDLAESKFHNEYPADEKTVFGGPWGDESKHVHLPIPDGVDYRKCNLIEVVLIPPNTEDDIDFDYKCEYTSNFESFTKYYKFEEDAGKASQVDADDAAVATKAAKDAKKSKGDHFRTLANDILAVITGHVYDNGLDLAQQTQLKTENATAFQLLDEGQPLQAKPLIDALVADGTLITQAMLDDTALEYTEFFEAYPNYLP